tara:strand:+ start:72 stop:5351 length:5280 start_codon:yes stop_codon:yes gene_type:complete
MAKQLFEIKDFSSGLMTNADLKDLPDGASAESHGLSPNSGYGVAESIYDNSIIMDNVPAITSMVVRPGLELDSPSDLAVNIDRYLINIPGYRSDTGLSEFYRILEKGELIPNGDFSEPEEISSQFHTNAPIMTLQNETFDSEAQGGLNYIRLRNTLNSNTNSKFRLWLMLDVQPGFAYKFSFRMNSDMPWTGAYPSDGDRNPIGGKLYCMDAKYDAAGAMHSEDSEDHFPENSSDDRILKSMSLNYNQGVATQIIFIPKEPKAFLCFDFDATTYGAPYSGIFQGGHQAYLSKFSCKLHLGTYLFSELGEHLDMSDSDRGLFVSGENIVPHILHQAYDSDGDVSRYIQKSECTPYLSKYSISNIDQIVAVPSLTGTMNSAAGTQGEVAVDSVIMVYGQDSLYRTVYDDTADTASESYQTPVVEQMQGELGGIPVGGMCVARPSSRAVPSDQYDGFTRYIVNSGSDTYEFAQESGLNGYATTDLYNNIYVFEYQGYKIHKLWFESTVSDPTPTPKIKYTISIDPSDVNGYINGISHSYGQDGDGYHYIYFSVFIPGGLKANKESNVGDTAVYAVRDKQGIQEAKKLYSLPSYMHLTAYTSWSVRRNWLGMRRDVNPRGACNFYWPSGGSYVPVSYRNGSQKDEDHKTAYGYTNDVCWINKEANDVALNIPNNSIDCIDRIYEDKNNTWHQIEKRAPGDSKEQADIVTFITEPLGATAFLEYSGVCHKIIQNPYWIPDSWGSPDGWWTHIDEHQTIQDGGQLVLLRAWDDTDDSDRGIKEFELDLRPGRSDNLQEQKAKMVNAIEWMKQNNLPSTWPTVPSSTGTYNHPDTDGGTGCHHSSNHIKYSPNYPPSKHSHLKNGFIALKAAINGSTANELIDSLLSESDPDMSLANTIVNQVKSGSTDRILTYFNWSDSFAGWSVSGWSEFQNWYNKWSQFTSAKQAIDSDLSETTIAGFDRDYIRHFHLSTDAAGSDNNTPSTVLNPEHLFTAIVDPSWANETVNSTSWKELVSTTSGSEPSDQWEPTDAIIFTESLFNGNNNIMMYRALVPEASGDIDFTHNSQQEINSLSTLMNKIDLKTSPSYNMISGYFSDDAGNLEYNHSMKKDVKIDNTGADPLGVHWPSGDAVATLEATSCFSPPGFITNIKDGVSEYTEIVGNYAQGTSPNYVAQGLWTSTYTGKLRLDKLAFNKSTSVDAFTSGGGSGQSDIASTWVEGISPGIEVTNGTINTDPDDGTETEVGAYLANGETVMYNISLLFDGYQEGPLLPTPVTFTADNHLKSTEVRVSIVNTNARVTHVQLYKKKDILDNWRMIGSKPVDNDWKPSGVHNMFFMQGTMNFTFTDDVDTQGVSYSALTGIPETLGSTMINYEESATAGDYMFVARADIEGMADAHKLIFRSEPGKFSIFNWPQNYVGIDEIPITMLGVQNRLYVWSEKAMYVIDPFNMIVEDRIPGKGVNSRHAVLNYNNLCVFANETGVYAFEGKVVEISHPIKNEWLKLVRSIGNKFKIKLAHNPKHDSIMVFFDNAGTASVDKVPTDVFAYTAKGKRWDKWKFPSKVKAVTTSENNTCLICAESESVKSYDETGMPVDADGELMDNYTYALYELHEGAQKMPIEFHTKRFTLGSDSRLKKFKKLKLTAKDAYICRVEIDGFFRDYTEDDATYENGYIQTLDLRDADGNVIGTPSTEYGLEGTEPYIDPETNEEVYENRNLDFNLTGSYIALHIKSKATTTSYNEDTQEDDILYPDSSIESIGIIYSVKAIK